MFRMVNYENPFEHTQKKELLFKNRCLKLFKSSFRTQLKEHLPIDRNRFESVKFRLCLRTC